MTSHCRSHLVFSGSCFSLQVFLAGFRPMSKYWWIAPVSPRPYEQRSPLYHFLFCNGTWLSSLGTVLQTCRWGSCPVWTDETWYHSFVEIATGVLTPSRFLSRGTISWAQQKWNRSMTWNVPVRCYVSHIFLKSTMI